MIQDVVYLGAPVYLRSMCILLLLGEEFCTVDEIQLIDDVVQFVYILADFLSTVILVTER